MSYTTLLSVAELRALLPEALLIDCSFDLADPGAGERAYAAGHLPGACYAHLDRDLSGAKSGRNGRHPLPERAALAAWAGRLGLRPGRQAVCYDAQGGPYAARAWWLLRWLGHREVAVLDGGLQAWVAAGLALSTGEAERAGTGAPYPDAGPAMPTIDAASLQATLGQRLLLDARAIERFRGDVEPLDPVAGHIPGARQRFFKDNLGADGSFKPVAELRQAFEALGAIDATQTIQQCGSGVTACHNLLALEYAGLGTAALYPGSWSEWCADPTRPVARG